MSLILEMMMQYPSVLAWVSLVSVGGMVFSVFGITRVVCWLPANYFVVSDTLKNGQKLFRPEIRIVKNIAGLFMVFFGLIMLITPGQGMLTLFLGLVIMDFPGKRKVIRFLIRLKTIQTALNWIRRKKRRPPFVFPEIKNRES